MKYPLRILLVLVALAAGGAMLARHLLRERTYFSNRNQTIDVETTDNAIVVDMYSTKGYQDICCVTIIEQLPDKSNGKWYRVEVPLKAVVLDELVHATIRISLDGHCNAGDLDLLGELKKQTAEKISFRKLPHKAIIIWGPHMVELVNSYRITIDSQERECVLTVLFP